MAQGNCSNCGAAIGVDDETCPACGELTPLGWRRDAEHRREFESKGTVSVGMMCAVAFVCALVVLVVVALEGVM